MLNLRARWEGKCKRHPGYNPEKHGAAGIKGGCQDCLSLFNRCMSVKEGVNNTGGVMVRAARVGK